MNNVDWIDLFRANAATVRKEFRVTMSMIYFVFDAKIISNHTLLKALGTEKEQIHDTRNLEIWNR